jgi:hypothetical protein
VIGNLFAGQDIEHVIKAEGVYSIREKYIEQEIYLLEML